MSESAHPDKRTVNPDDLEQRVRQRASELYQRGQESGIEDWLQAEDEIRSMEDQKKGHP
jgi:hypothetical protein